MYMFNGPYIDYVATVEPLNKGLVGAAILSFVERLFVERLSALQGFKCIKNNFGKCTFGTLTGPL